MGSTSPTSVLPISATFEQSLDALKQALGSAQTDIDRAEERKIRSRASKLWVNELKEIAYDAQDVLDDAATLRIGVSGTGFTEVRDANALEWNKIEARAREISERYDEVRMQRKYLRLRKADVKVKEKSDATDASARAPTGAYSSERNLIGRVDDQKAIINMLDPHEDLIDDLIVQESKRRLLEKYKNVIVVPIIGDAGIGKTTLVQHVYDDYQVRPNAEGTGFFEVRGWGWVSEHFDAVRLTNAILESIDAAHGSRSNQLDIAQKELEKLLRGKRFLLVLDDVWSKDEKLWEKFWAPLISGAERSIVIITARDDGVLKGLPRTLRTDLYPLGPLDSDSEWQLFQHHASEKASLFEEIRDKISDKCKGSPLAVKEVARLLRSEPNMERWDNVLRRDILESDDRRKEILLDLEVGYRGLRAAVKRCFIFCSLFPKKYQFKKDYLIRLWMAEGFLQLPEPESVLEPLKAEKLGTEYFDELLSRSFLLYSMDREDAFVMPNLVHDLAQSISGDYCSRTENEAPESEDALARDEESILWEPSSGVRHSSLVVRNYKAEIQCHPPHESSTLRSFLVISVEGIIARTNFPGNMFVNMGYIRTLDLSYTNLKELPESISKMKHLHFLGLDGTEIRMLPESILTLHNLQSLQLRYCRNLEELPNGIGNLSSLRHLGLDTSLKISSMPSGIGKLTELQTLPLFKMGKNAGFSGLSELEKLNGLTGELCISGLCNVESIEDCKHACLSDKVSLEKLALMWSSHRDDLEYLQLSDDDDDDDEDNDNDDEGVIRDEAAKQEEEDGIEEGQFIENGNQDIFEVECPMYDIDEQPSLTNNLIFIREQKKMDIENPQAELHILIEGKIVYADEILEHLQPPSNLEFLTIQSYEGLKFSDWLTDSSFKKLKYVSLKNCKMCQQLPSLGLLPSLESLSIDNVPVKSIGPEFCGETKDEQRYLASGSDCSSGDEQQRFPLLDEFHLKEMRELEDWSADEGDFPNLQNLSLFNCPKLRKLPCFTSLVKLEIENCVALTTLPTITSLETLHAITCGLTTIPIFQSLENLTVMYCDRLTSLPPLQPKMKLWIKHCKHLPDNISRK